MLNGTPVACGMKYDPTNKDCYSFNGNSWTLFATTFYHHHENAGILLRGNFFIFIRYRVKLNRTKGCVGWSQITSIIAHSSNQDYS